VSHDAVIHIEHVSKTFRQFSERNQTLKSAVMRGRVSKHRDFAALTDITFDVHRGETFGLIGSNGSGKSTLLRCIARILTPNEGRITVTGRVGALLEVGSGFHAELTGRENVFLAGAIAGLSRKDVTRVLDEIVDFAGIGDFIDEPVKNYSSGMYVRLGFSTAVAVRPDILLADEILAVGDAEFQAKCLARIESMRASGTTIVLVTHDITKIEKFCGRAAWIDHGQLKLVGSAETVAAAYSASLGHTEG
jgi:lipopolysaccharide transport system ATP-binding protein